MLIAAVNTSQEYAIVGYVSLFAFYSQARRIRLTMMHAELRDGEHWTDGSQPATLLRIAVQSSAGIYSNVFHRPK